MSRLFTILFIELLSAGCASPFSEKEEMARDELLILAPIGSDVREAKPKLEKKGFKCHWSEKQYFSGLKGKHDYLYCDKTVLAGPLVTRRWQLALVHEFYAVKDAKFGIGLIGP